jgi:hypothetical protein
MNPKTYKEPKRPLKSKKKFFLSKKNKLSLVTVPDYKIYYKAIVIKTGIKTHTKQ